MNIIVKGGTMSPDEKKIYVDYLTEKYPTVEFTDIEFTIELDSVNGEEMVNMRYSYKNKDENNIPFSRIRRITGYLVGDTSRWNNAKISELEDRVKHSYGCDIANIT